MNNLEATLSVVAAALSVVTIIVSIKTIIDARNNSVDEFMKKREERKLGRDININKKGNINKSTPNSF